MDGQSLGDLDPQVWRSQVAWVSQNPYLFNDTVISNIRLGRPEATLEEVERAARQAEAHEFIQALPQGYETVIGERGARLSAGQAQRIALARAFLVDAPLVILDEATANLDPHSEALVQASLERLLQGRTALIIAHRLTTARSADQIVVLDHGRGGGERDACRAFCSRTACTGSWRRLLPAKHIRQGGSMPTDQVSSAPLTVQMPAQAGFASAVALCPARRDARRRRFARPAGWSRLAASDYGGCSAFCRRSRGWWRSRRWRARRRP